MSRYAWGATDYHDLIRERLHRLADSLREWQPDGAGSRRGRYGAAAWSASSPSWPASVGSARTRCCSIATAGSWFFLAALLTDVELAYDAPHETDHCGTCRACLDACPTGAFPQPYVLDASRCISYLTIELREAMPVELRSGVGDWVFGCDVCQEVCPWNSHAEPSRQAMFEPLRGEQSDRFDSVV